MEQKALEMLRGDEAQVDLEALETEKARNVTEAVTTAYSDENALNLTELYQRKSQDFVRGLRKLFGAGPPDPEDIMQQAFQKLMEKYGGTSGQTEVGRTSQGLRDPEAYLWRTARNLILNERRAVQTRSRYDFETEQLFFADRGVSCGPERVIAVREQLSIINAALGAMPEMRRRCFVLHRIDGLSLSQAAKRIGLSRTAVTKHVTRALRDIDLALGEER
ncbi:MAG: RNA polymerase sigma factor [Pseudomonadota bacterium]